MCVSQEGSLPQAGGAHMHEGKIYQLQALVQMVLTNCCAFGDDYYTLFYLYMFQKC